MQQKTGFRCPFEQEGIRKNTIVEVILSEDRAERLAAIRRAYQAFHAHTEISALRFVLPPSLRESCSSNRELFEAALPYQGEFVAVDVDMILGPLLHYNAGLYAASDAVPRFELFQRDAAIALTTLFRDLPFGTPQSVGEFADWHATVQRFIRRSRPKQPWLSLKDGKNMDIMYLEPGAARIACFVQVDDNPMLNRNLVGVFLGPFYPEAFPRYSERIENVVTREADIANVAIETRRVIKSRANSVYAEHGIAIPQIDASSIPLGVWVPEDHGDLLTVF